MKCRRLSGVRPAEPLREVNMSSIALKLCAAVSVAGVVELATVPADARNARATRGGVSNQAINSQSVRRSQNSFRPAPGGGINFNDGRMGANYRPGQG